MVKHKKIYLKHFDYGEQDMVPSEYSGKRAEHIHHLIFRSQGGEDEIGNLMALTGEEHDRAHNDREFNEMLKHIHRMKVDMWNYLTSK